MVKSGLDEEKISKTEIPRVSQYRLAAHLTLAFLLYSGLVWCALCQFIPRPKVHPLNSVKCGSDLLELIIFEFFSKR